MSISHFAALLFVAGVVLTVASVSRVRPGEHDINVMTLIGVTAVALAFVLCAFAFALE